MQQLGSTNALQTRSLVRVVSSLMVSLKEIIGGASEGSLRTASHTLQSDEQTRGVHSLKELLFSQCNPTSGESQPVRNVALHWAANGSWLHVKALHHVRHSHNWGIYTRQETKVKVYRRDWWAVSCWVALVGCVCREKEAVLPGMMLV